MTKISNYELWFLQTIFTNKEKYIAYKIIKENPKESVYNVIKFIKNTEKKLSKRLRKQARGQSNEEAAQAFVTEIRI